MRSFGNHLDIGALTSSVGMLLLASACSGTYRGAAEVSPSEVPRGRLVATFARKGCVGDHAVAPRAFIDFVQGANGKPFIVERSQPDSWFLVTNGLAHGDVVVFQAIRVDAPTEFREYRFPAGGTRAGQFFWSSQYAKPRGKKHRFESRPVGSTTTCQLVPVDPITGAALTPPGALPTASSTSARGWGFDGRSFRVGDRVLVDVDGRSLPAQVLKAPGHAYFVHFEGEPADAGRWIEPSRITGRVEQEGLGNGT